MTSIPQFGTQPSTLVGNMAVAKLVGYLVLIDLLFLPYLQLVIIPFSLPLICLAIFVLGTRINTDNYVALFGLLAVSAVVSVAVSFTLPGSGDNLAENFKRLIQLLSSFVYFFYFRWLASRVPLKLSRISAAFIAWFAILAAAFLLRPEATGEFLRTVYGKLVTSEETLAEHLRFAYLFTDPNSAAYFLLMAAVPLLLTRRSLLSLGFTAAIVGAVTFVTQSRGALLVLVFMILVIIYPPPKLLQTMLSARRATAVAMTVLLVAGVIIYLRITAEATTDIIKMAYERIFETDDVASGGSRFEIWQRLLGYYYPMPVGRGFVLEIGGIPQRPHSDLLRFMYSYGLLATIPALWFLFSRIGTFTPLVLPALAAFMINTLIDEQKLLALFLSLLAIYIGSEERQARERERRRFEAHGTSSRLLMPPDGPDPPAVQNG
jgi:hypothetical protein